MTWSLHGRCRYKALLRLWRLDRAIRVGRNHSTIPLDIRGYLLLLLLEVLLLLLLKLLLLSLDLLLLLLVLDTQTGEILLRPLQGMGRQVTAANASKDERHHGGRNTTLQ